MTDDAQSRPPVGILHECSVRGWLASLLRSLDYQPIPCGEADGAGEDEEAVADVPPDLLAVFAGGTRDPTVLAEQVASWISGEPSAPLVLVDPAPEEGALDRALAGHVIGRIAEPFPLADLVSLLQQARLWHHSAAGDGELLFRGLVGPSAAVERVRRFVLRVAHTPVTVLVTGETGTGKEVIARNIHAHSKRADGPFVAVNCGAIPGELLESELFGHEKGAFTGAVSARKGRFELAEGGTLFLDEIGEMPTLMQVKLLRVLQERAFERVGGQKALSSDVRVIAATNRDIEAIVQDGSFREDLYYRLNVCPVEMPPLRERLADLPLLVSEIQARLVALGYPTVRIARAAHGVLEQWPWPGNVRELVNLVERLSVLHPHQRIEPRHLPPAYLEHAGIAPPEEDADLAAPVVEEAVADAPPLSSDPEAIELPAAGIDMKQHLAGIECALIQRALEEAGGVTARAAELLGLRRTTLAEKMRKYGIERDPS